MTTQGRQAAAIWRDEGFATSWAAGDTTTADLLAVPRRIAAEVVAGDNPSPAEIMDIGAGPGAVLAVFLQRFPGAHGTWSDASEAMLAMARENLAPFGARVDYRLADMTALDDAGLPATADVITTSRAAHHLDSDGLIAFYSAAARRLGPGGWLVNLDHVGPASAAGPAGVAGPDEVWDQRLRAVRKELGITSDGPKHHHDYPLTSVQDHLDAFTAAGITDVEVVWRAFFTCLFMGRKAE
ncbi:MAG TPA: class I SAM-dependent methyltransferase [Trebonia sp.]|jgi:SAM-dependent methyltransferase|nr:class I SAM-dependent methyltransferase [Trebonia sp.]